MTRLEDKNENPMTRRIIEGASLLVAVAIALTIGLGVFGSAIVISGSMESTFLIGDKVLLDHRAGLHGHWGRGDVVLFDVPQSWKRDENDEDTLLKRVIGLPGETVQVSADQTLINGKELNESYIKARDNETDPAMVILGQNEYFVMGDNRPNSEDSRVKGPINDSDIRGRVVMRIAPLSRFGKILRPDYAE